MTIQDTPAINATSALLVKPKRARELLAVGNTRLYELLAAGELESFLDGRSRKITVESIWAYIARKLVGSGAVEPIENAQSLRHEIRAR